MGSFKKVVLPIFKGVFEEIKGVGLKRSMTFARILVDALNARLGDDHLSRDEMHEIGKITKAEAHEQASGLIQDGLKISGGAADALIIAAVRAANEGIDSLEMGIKPEDEEDESP
jgi:hypothetical protein